jgi:hypothetical protein
MKPPLVTPHAATAIGEDLAPLAARSDAAEVGLCSWSTGFRAAGCSSTRRWSSGKPACPYELRLIHFSLWLNPSTIPLLHASVQALAIASASSVKPSTKLIRQPSKSIWSVPRRKIIEGRAREHNGYALSDFSIDWEREQAHCPQGQTSSSWTPTQTRNQEIIKLSLALPLVGPVLHMLCVRRLGGEACQCGDKKHISLSLPLVNESKPRSSSKSMPGEQASKGSMPKACGRWACGARATLESLAPISSMW